MRKIVITVDEYNLSTAVHEITSALEYEGIDFDYTIEDDKEQE